MSTYIYIYLYIFFFYLYCILHTACWLLDVSELHTNSLKHPSVLFPLRLSSTSFALAFHVIVVEPLCWPTCCCPSLTTEIALKRGSVSGTALHACLWRCPHASSYSTTFTVLRFMAMSLLTIVHDRFAKMFFFFVCKTKKIKVSCQVAEWKVWWRLWLCCSCSRERSHPPLVEEDDLKPKTLNFKL